MPRKKKQQIRTNDKTSLEGLLQETYNDACGNINDAQLTINDIVNASEPETVDDLSKIAKEKTSALKIKDSAIRIKLEIAKLQSDILKHSGNNEAAINDISGGKVGIEDFREIRKMMEKSSSDDENEGDD